MQPALKIPFALKLSLFISRPILFLFLLVFFAIYAIATGALWYHWSKYGMGHREIAIVKILFVFISLVLFFLAVVAISYL
jgi:hypothetical protein